MKTKSKNQSRAGAFTALEVLATVVILSILVTGAVGMVHFMRKAAMETRLQTQVRQLNAAAAVYESSGGTLAGVVTVEGVLAKMKTVANAVKRERIAGLRGSFIDAGTTAVMQTEAESRGTDARVVWDPAKRRFAIVVRGLGAKRFEVDPELALAETQEEDRTASLLLASGDGWVWDYQDFASSGGRPMNFNLLPGGGTGGTGSPYPAALRLNPPVFSVEGGTYDFLLFDLPVYLRNENPTASSSIVYTLGDGVWREYDGRGIMVGPNKRLTAYAVANDPENWMDSTQESSFYRSSFRISGNAKGTFRNAVGGPNLVTGGSGSTFTWGTAVGTPDPSWLLFNGASFLDVNPEERFLLGEISYYNGTIRTGTGADSVKMGISLGFGGATQVQDFNYTLNLINTANLSSNTLDQNADYVRFGNIRSETPMTLGGVDYTLVLEFGETTANGFSTIDQFFVHEDRMARGRLYGTLVPVPQKGIVSAMAGGSPSNTLAGR